MMTSETLRKVAFLTIGNNIHVLDQGSQGSSHIVIRAPCTVLTASLATSISTRQTSLIITTCENQIWLVPSSQLVQNDLRKTRSEVEKSEDKMDQEDIFGDLLDNAQSDLSSLGYDDLKRKPAISKNTQIIVLRSQHLLYSVDGTVLDAETVNDLVSVLVDRSGIAEVHSFKICEDQQCEDITKIILIERFTTGLDSTHFYNCSVKKTKCLFFVKSVRKKCSDTFSALSPSLGASQTQINIPIQLFTIMFGKEAACLSSPVLMLCTDNGYVYSFEVKSVKSTAQKRLNVVCQMDSDIVGILPIQISQQTAGEASRLKDIVSALVSSLREEHADMSSSSEASTCLLIVSSTGRGCLFVPPAPENDCPPILMFSVPHPVTSIIVHGKSVVYSTGKSVEACQLTLMSGQDDAPFCVTPILRTLMGKARIIKLLPFELYRETEGTTISAVTCSYDLVSISAQLKETRPEPIAEEASHSLKDLLQSIEKCSSIYQSLKKDSLCVDSCLLQVNIFATLVQNKAQRASATTTPLSHATADITDPLITCVCNITSTQNIYKRNWSLKIVLRNTCAISLSEDWMVFVTLCDNKEGVYNPADKSFNQSYSIPLSRGLKFQSSIDLYLPLDRLIEFHPIPSVDVRVFLSLSFKDVSSEGIQIKDLYHNSVSVEIHKQKIDICHFFHTFCDQSLSSEVRSGYFQSSLVSGGNEHWLHSELNKLAHTQITGKLKDSAVQDKSQILNMRVGISELECKEHKLFNSMEVLAFLLNDSNILLDQTLGPHIQLEDPHGHLIMLMAYASPTENSDKPSSQGIPLIVTLKGENLCLLLQVRAAIKSRLQVQNSKVSALQSKSCGELRKQLTILEGVQKELHNIRNKLVSHRNNEDETVKLVCEMIDKSELLTKST